MFHGCVPMCVLPDAPQITTAPKDQKVVEDGVVSFFCKASGNPSPDIHWQKGGKRISSNRQRYLVVNMAHGSVLRIEPAKPRKDDSVFDCVADNGIGERAVASATLEVYPKGQGSSKGRASQRCSMAELEASVVTHPHQSAEYQTHTHNHRTLQLHAECSVKGCRTP